LLYVAAESPLDAFDSTYLSAHMTQHLLLMMLAPGLILLGHPVLPLLRGLPRRFVRALVRPLLLWPELRRFFELVSSPPAALAIYAASTVAWHVPYLYELALSSPVWHAAEHASFFWTGILFWWPVIRPGLGKSHWPQWIAIPYLLVGDALNTALSAFFVFSGKLLYPSYAAVQIQGRSALEDQMLAGAIMWVPGSIVYLIPAVMITVRLLSPARYPVRPLVLRRP
jgi:cytochrome c oxidase assembly factor CtaG